METSTVKVQLLKNQSLLMDLRHSNARISNINGEPLDLEVEKISRSYLVKYYVNGIFVLIWCDDYKIVTDKEVK